jgi:hypothetical protein
VNHLTPDELSAHLDGATTGATRQRAEAHLAGCEICRAALAELAARDRALRSTLEHDPGDAYFETFAARVEDRIRARGLRGAQSRLGAGGWLGWMRSPRRLAWVGAVAAVIGGAAIVILSSREIHRPMVNPALESKLSDVAPLKERAAQGARDQAGATARLSPEEMTRLERDQAQPSAAKPSLREQTKGEVGLVSRALPSEEAAPAAPPAAAREEQSLARPSTPSDEAAGGTTPARLQQSQRNASGEDVPVHSNFAAPPPKAAVGSTSLKDAKRQAAPLQNAPSAPSADALAPLPAGQTRLCGRVVDPNGRPVSGAVVALADRGLTVSSDAEGAFCMDAPEGLHELTAMAIGYESTRLQVHVEGETSQASVILRPVSVLGGGALAKKSTPPAFRLDGGSAQSVPSPLKNPQSSHDRQALDQAWAARDSAIAQHTAAAFDAAAKAWSRVVPLAAPGPPQLQSRALQAEMSHQAWKLGPTSTRANTARAAIDAYLREAPSGPARDQAVTWRRELGP